MAYIPMRIRGIQTDTYILITKYIYIYIYIYIRNTKIHKNKGLMKNKSNAYREEIVKITIFHVSYESGLNTLL